MNTESPLGAALRTISRRKQQKPTIRVCDDCGTPLIWTFCWAYRERYCLNCGQGGGMMGTGKDVEATRELKFKKRLVDAIWNVLYGRKGLIPRSSFTRTGCDKCRGGASHPQHLTATEKEWDELATKYLEKFQGLFT